jgi:uncharacterized membrane protein
MVTKQLNERRTRVAGPNGERGEHVDQTLTLDDSWLPPADELAKYHALDPNVVAFIIEATKKEQDFRHDFDRKRLKVFDKGNRREFSINMWGMVFAFLVMALGLGLAAFLVYCDKIVYGSIFGGIALAIAASVFVRRRSEISSKK